MVRKAGCTRRGMSTEQRIENKARGNSCPPGQIIALLLNWIFFYTILSLKFPRLTSAFPVFLGIRLLGPINETHVF